MDTPVDGRSGSVENPLMLGMDYQVPTELRLGVVVVPGRSRVHVRGLRLGGGVKICRVLAAVAAGEVSISIGTVETSAYFPSRLLVRDESGDEFVAFGDECTPVGGRHASKAGAARLRALVGDPLR